MTDKELNELLEYNQEYIDARLSEDVFGGDYTSEVELKYLKKDYDKLQSNWNSLREWLEERIEHWENEEKKWIEQGFMKFGGEANIKIIYKGVLDKMNELEGKDK